MQIVRKMEVTAYKQPPTECMVELEFDEERALRFMAEAALRNKSKKTRMGWVTVRVRPTQAALARGAK